MLSYMLPVEEKPPPGPKGHLQLTLAHQSQNGHTSSGNPSNQILTNGKSRPPLNTPISKESSVSSFVSDTTATASHSSMTPTSTSTDRGKPKFSMNGKHQSLKRVSFGSSKGSMVETLIFESPLQEEPEPSPIPENGISLTNGCDKEDEREKVRVTFFQQSKPQEVDLPDDPPFCDSEFIMSSPVMKNDSNHVIYNRTESTESGWDNPFRPGGDLSREADQIVELIKGGKPITPTPGSEAPPLPSGDDSLDQNHTSLGDSVDAVSPKKTTSALNATTSNNQSKTNGTTEKTPTPGQVDVQRSTIKAEGDGAQVEHVTLKKKKGCQCCVLS
ncbi:uncharacterized protein LOC126739150 [Anthonomus grandis grandis]|uniref:uncharacterized protein LOC126739150 n=1 Tax=Anthonomus grandis grandis TaxID=2921223 RepID=UPI0021663355|nr:uncharacterized protein LOC126739150 [Anthonomus grandis grandis]